MNGDRKSKIAIIGSGVSGLVTAHILNERHDVTVFEADDRIGGHAHTIPVELDGATYPADVGFVVYNDRTYPKFSALLTDLGVESIATQMSFSVRDDHAGVEYNGGSLRGLFAQPRNACSPRFLRMLADIARFNRRARSVASDSTQTLTDFLEQERYSRALRDWYVMPMIGCIWSVPRSSAEQFPIGPLAAFMRNHGLLDLTGRPVWKTIRGGASRYVEALAQPFRHLIRLQAPVCEVRRNEGSVRVRTRDGGAEKFDEVVIAVHGDKVLDLLVDADIDERATFETIRYVENDVVLHMDERLLPRSPHARACWNAVVGRDPAAPVVVTYDLNLLQRIGAPQPICVSLNAGDAIAPHAVLRRLHYRHPVLDVDAVTRMQRIGSLSGRKRIYYCGAYIGYGFHEDGVRSAMAVSERILAQRA